MQTGGGHQLCHTELAMALICTGWKKGPTSSFWAGWRFRMTEAAWRILMASSLVHARTILSLKQGIMRAKDRRGMCKLYSCSSGPCEHQ